MFEMASIFALAFAMGNAPVGKETNWHVEQQRPMTYEQCEEKRAGLDERMRARSMCVVLPNRELDDLGGVSKKGV